MFTRLNVTTAFLGRRICIKRLVAESMSEVRRSTRIRDKSSRTDAEDEDADSLGLVHADDRIDLGSESEEDDDEDANERDDEDYQDTAIKKRKRSASEAGTDSRRGAKKSRLPSASRGSKRSREAFQQLQQGFEPTQLFQALAESEDISVEETANEWLDLYSESRERALQEFINFILNSCGSLVQVQEHDVTSNETANETVAEIQLMFQKQGLHENHLRMSKTNKKRAKFKPLYQNFTEFMHKVMELSNERGLLYEESPRESGESNSLILDILTWLSSFSVSKLRCLRHAATLCMYSFQDYLTESSVILENNYLVKLRRQLSMEQKKKRANKKTAEKLESTIAEIQETKSAVENSIDNIIKLAFVHRFKDVDEAIRADSISHLATWLENYPEYFMKVTFLKYFGWLLSDSSAMVRLQVMKVLSEVVKFDIRRSKHKVGSSALRQFFERFKQRILEICIKDVDMQVRLTAIQVLTQINSFGYLEDTEISKISSLIFDYQEINIASSAKHAKFLASVAKFFATVQKDKIDQALEAHSFPRKLRGLEPEDVVRVGFFMRSLITSLSAYLKYSQDDTSVQERTHLLFQASEFLQPFFGDSISSMCKLLLYDGDLSEFAEISENDDSNEKLLLLPGDENSTIQFMIVLNGLCHGGVNNKSAKKSDVISAVLPHLEQLFATLPLHSAVITHHLFGIYMLFSFEDWGSAGLEGDFQKITEVIVKNFDRMQFSNDKDDIKRLSYAKLLQFHQQLDLPNLNEVWKDQVGHVRIPLQVFLETRGDDFEGQGLNELYRTVFESYVNKLVLLGKVVPLDFSKELMQLFFSKVVGKLPQALEFLEMETLKSVDFKFVALVVLWNLQRWYEILQNTSDASPISRGVLDMVIAMVKELSAILVTLATTQSSTLQARLHVEWKICDALADILTAFKMFELNLPEKDYEWKHVVSREYAVAVKRDLAEVFLEVFLYLEGLWAKELDVQLDRFENEDVDLNNISDHTFEGAEQELLVYVVKLKSLLKLGLIEDPALEKRISLNKSILGQDFQSIIDEDAFSTEPGPKRSLASANHERQIFENRELNSPEELDPIQESSDPPEVPPLADPHTAQEDTEPHGYSSEFL